VAVTSYQFNDEPEAMFLFFEEESNQICMSESMEDPAK
jgi:hypothetical protein